MDYEFFFDFILMAIAVFILIRSGVYIVRSLIGIAHFLKISEFVLSFILMSFATTLPEFSIGINSALAGKPIISLGNIIGANILVLSLVLGVVAVISGKLEIHKPKTAAASHHWFTFFMSLAPLFLLLDGELSRIDGAILIFLFLLYLIKLAGLRDVFQEGKSFWANHFVHGHSKLSIKHFIKNIAVFIGAAGLLLFSAFLTVDKAQTVSGKIGLPPFLVGIFLIGFGTTLPELSFGIRAALRKRGELSLGNLFGVTVFNSNWILGIVSLISPIIIRETFQFWFSAAAMSLVLFLANYFLRSRYAITRREGIALIGIYIVFFVLQIFFL